MKGHLPGSHERIEPLGVVVPRPGEGTHVISQDGRRADGTRWQKGDPQKRPQCTKPEREHTPPLLAEWLIELARRTRVSRTEQVAA